jgi:membrane AbrB-like protein
VHAGSSTPAGSIRSPRHGVGARLSGRESPKAGIIRGTIPKPVPEVVLMTEVGISPFLQRRAWGGALGGLSLAVGAGWLCAWAHTPLPWMIGPLFALGGARLAGVPAVALPGARYAGQWIIGSALGLYFTPVVVRQVALFAPWMVLAGVYALAVSIVCSWVLGWFAGVDRRTAFFASVPGGATEMSILADRFGARTDLVAVAQSLRIVLVVTGIPFLYTWLGVRGADPYVQGAREFSWPGLVMLMALTAVGGSALHRFRFPNGWVIGALCVALPLTALEINLSTLPAWLSNMGQLLIGSALASRFQPDFLSRAPRFVLAVTLTVLLAMALAAFFALLLAWAMPAHPATTVLAMAPGGIAEMSITAKVLQLGVPVVTAFHVTRMVLLVSTTGLLFRMATTWHAKRALPRSADEDRG